MFSSKFWWLSMILYQVYRQNHIIQNRQWDLLITHGSSWVKRSLLCHQGGHFYVSHLHAKVIMRTHIWARNDLLYSLAVYCAYACNCWGYYIGVDSWKAGDMGGTRHDGPRKLPSLQLLIIRVLILMLLYVLIELLSNEMGVPCGRLSTPCNLIPHINISRLGHHWFK